LHKGLSQFIAQKYATMPWDHLTWFLF
jgi:hypothetical protein